MENLGDRQQIVNREPEPSPADRPELKEAIARQREKLKVKLAGKAAAGLPADQVAGNTAKADERSVLERAEAGSGLELVSEQPVVEGVKDLKKQEEAQNKLTEALKDVDPTNPQKVLFDKEKYKQIEESFVELNGKSLTQMIKDAARKEVEKTGGRVISKVEYFGEKHVAAVAEQVKKEIWERTVQDSWSKNLSEEERKAYKGDIKNYVNDLQAKREALKKEGIEFDSYVWYGMISYGYRPQDIKIKSGWRKWLMKLGVGETEQKFVLPQNGGPGMVMREDDFSKWEQEIRESERNNIRQIAEGRLKNGYNIGRAKWINRKAEAGGRIIGTIVEEARLNSPVVAEKPEQREEPIIETSGKEEDFDQEKKVGKKNVRKKLNRKRRTKKPSRAKRKTAA